MVEKVRVEGLRELDRKLKRLGDEVAGKKVMRGALFDAAKPIFLGARANAESVRDSGALAAAMGRWFRQLSRTMFAMFVGPRSRSKKAVALWTAAHGAPPRGNRLNHAHLTEFGSREGRAQPFMRPAFDANAPRSVGIFAKRLRERIEKIARIR